MSVLICSFSPSLALVMDEFPQEDREPVIAKEGQGAVLLCVPPKAWPGMT